MSDDVIFRDIVDDLLEQILKKYPPERINRIKSRMNDFWNHKPASRRIPYAIWGGEIKGLPRLPENISEDDSVLVYQLQYILQHSDWDDDFFPALSPGVRQVTVPSYFGCTEEKASASVRVKPAILDPKDVYSLPDVGFGPETPGGEMLERMRYWREMTHGMLTLYEADLQGPFSVASQIWGIQEFMLATYDSPDEVHYLLKRCTNAIIKYAKLMYEAVDGDIIPFHCLPAIWYPREKGIAVSEDLVVVVSPAIVKEFVRPYLEQIADVFGGVFMHTCGSINDVICELNNVKGLIGLNFNSCESDLEKALTDVKKSLFIVSHNGPVNRVDLPLLTPVQHVELCAKLFTSKNIHGLSILYPSDEESLKKQMPEVEKAVAIA